MDETRTLAKFVAAADYGQLPDHVVQHAKNLILDHFAVSLFASKTVWGRIAVKYAREFSAIAEATVYGEPWQTSAQHAALVNGLCAHGYELDDSYEGGYCHPGAPTIPAALAVAEKEQGSGRDFLLGVVMGYELMGRISAAIGREANKQHHATAQVGTFGAAAAAAKIMKLDAAAVTNALGVAGSMSSGVMEFADDPKGTMVKRLYGGWPSQSGVVAAWLAREGFTGPSTIVEGRMGFLRGITPNFNLAGVTANLGEDYHIMRAVFKPYASCRAFHPLIEAIAELKKEHGVTARNIRSLKVGARESILNYQMEREPKSIMSAQYSMPFTAALAFYKDLADPRSFDEQVLSNPEVLATARQVEGYLDDEVNAFPRYGARITAEMQDGKKATVTAWDHRGTPAKPFNRTDITSRFHMVTAGIIDTAAAERIISAVDRLDAGGAENLKSLSAALRLSA
ncbi:MAG: MmgE/PrpD family protein [Betaproteobacteria bacterium]|nr:MmgE/PrpD family protein [Betaproteobacteria bacterium]